MKVEDIDISHIYNFMENGRSDNAPQEIIDYLHLLDKVHGMCQRIDIYGSKEAVVKHLVTVDKLSRLKANKVYEESREYFYRDSNISKAAYINIYAEKMEKLIAFAMLTMKDSSDAAKIAKMIVDVAKVRQLDVPDKEELPAELFRAPFIVYTSNAEELGMPKADRNKLAKIIDELPDVSEKAKMQIKREAEILPLNVFPDEQEDARKS